MSLALAWDILETLKNRIRCDKLLLENSAIAEPLGDSRAVVALIQIGKNFILSYLLKKTPTFYEGVNTAFNL
ncbi:hypothetical protein [Fredinandcohnia sp. 179-A 10B2 NHS]|uniref:hypothetical protein n=1 Tax=Fredinandcohnia sp. 179-A 10B2 NHS TaxID=3235176 RepID=UPI0039A0E36C